MNDRPPHYRHVIRVAGLFAVGFTAFLIVRALLVPSDFGVYGFYRAGALNDIRALPLHFASQAKCVECHTDVEEARQGSRHAKISCEACHGPLEKHASGDFDDKPATLNPRLLCLQCHTQIPGRPAVIPQIVPADHGGDGACTDCHQPHHPKISGN